MVNIDSSLCDEPWNFAGNSDSSPGDAQSKSCSDIDSNPGADFWCFFVSSDLDFYAKADPVASVDDSHFDVGDDLPHLHQARSPGSMNGDWLHGQIGVASDAQGSDGEHRERIVLDCGCSANDDEAGLPIAEPICD